MVRESSNECERESIVEETNHDVNFNDTFDEPQVADGRFRKIFYQ